MTLSFSTQLNGKPTYFPEKILAGLFENKILNFEKACDYLEKYVNTVDSYLLFNTLYTPVYKGYSKIHTIRKDPGRIYQKGQCRDFVIKEGDKEFCFAPKVTIQCIQNIFMTYLPNVGNGFEVSINGNMLCSADIENLAINDGFPSADDFVNYFIDKMTDHEFSGVIIHWTDLKYGS